MLDELNRVSHALANIMTVLAFIISIWVVLFFRKMSGTLCWIGLLFFISGAANLTSTLLLFWKKIPAINIPSALYILAAIVLLGIIYAYEVGGRFRKPVLTLAGLSGAFAAANLIWLQGTGFNSYSYSVNAFMVLGYGVLYFSKLMNDLPLVQIHRLPMFWFNSAFLIYHASTIVVFIFRVYLAGNSWETLAGFQIFHNSIGIIHMVLVMIGLGYAMAERNMRSNPV